MEYRQCVFEGAYFVDGVVDWFKPCDCQKRFTRERAGTFGHVCGKGALKASYLATINASVHLLVAKAQTEQQLEPFQNDQGLIGWIHYCW